ncbi:PAS domain-containing protein [Erythrobacter ramosus]|uniref:PAS domain-containing protein n=1 Tax=Erythrobacter ramosus TaxID=35811 RepID=A0A6I4UFY5_9SPHN|nr:PAS domain-containing protein [Erythrobacter ramosus]
MDSSTLTTLLDTVSQGVVVFGADRQIVYCNQAFLNSTGFDRSEMAGALCGIMQGSDTDCAVIAAIDAAIEARQAFSGEIRATASRARYSGTTSPSGPNSMPMRHSAISSAYRGTLPDKRTLSSRRKSSNSITSS